MDILKSDGTMIQDEMMMILRHVSRTDLLYFCKHLENTLKYCGTFCALFMMFTVTQDPCLCPLFRNDS